MPIEIGQIREFKTTGHGFQYRIENILENQNRVIVKITKAMGNTCAEIGRLYTFPIEEVESEKLISQIELKPQTNFTAKNKTKMEIRIKKCTN